MSFKTLDEAYHACKVLAEDRDVILSMLKAYKYVLTSLIATHHDHEQLQLHLATIETAVDPEVAFGSMSELERQAFDKTLGPFQAILPLKRRIDPLSQLREKP